MPTKGTIIVVDDSLESLRLITDVLTQEGYVVRPADSGELALASITASPPELILLDIQMPGIDGFEVCRQLKANSELSTIPIVFLSASIEMEERIQGLRLGAVDYITKPFQRDELLARVNTHIQLFKLQKKERQLMETSLLLSEARFRTFFEQAPLGIALVDSLTGAFYDVNPSFAVITERPVAELLKLDWMSITHPDDIQQDLDNIARMNTGKIASFSMHKRYLVPAGSFIWINLTAARLNVEDSAKPVHMVMIEDISEQKIAAEQLKNLNYQLEETNTSLEEEISERKRSEKEKIEMLEHLQKTQKLEALGLLAGGIAHDFNNLLSGVFGYIDIARDSTTDTKITYYLNQAMKIFNRAKALTSQLLTFAKGGAPVRKVGIISDCIINSANFALSGSDIVCQFNLDNKIWPCEFDENQMGQVIDNMIINAKQAMPSGGIIEISAENIMLDSSQASPKFNPGKYVKISIKDSGIGISKKDIDRIFEPFYTTKQTGSGLGLAISYSIIKKHGGILDVDSELGVGTSFYIYLPAIGEKGLADSQSPSPTISCGSGRILIMDDEPYIHEIESLRLQKMGYTVVSARNSEEAVSEFRQAKSTASPFAIVILDLTIPGGKGGIETLAMLKEIDPAVCAIVASGYSEDPVMASPTEYGFIAALKKPYNKTELSEILNRLQK